MAEAVLPSAPAAWSRGTLLLLAALLGLGALRAATVLASGAGLHVDEAQYWDWSRSLQWGYYSKPPAMAALIAASTAAFGDSLLGVRVLAMVCWLLASLVMWRLGATMGSEPAGRWAALCLAATPASGLLGLVATTDAPLMLCWSLLMFAVWRALQASQPSPWWCAAGLALGAGLLAKYTMAAAWLSLIWLVAMTRRRQDLRGLGACSALALLLLSPNLAWNAANDWPTLRHTAEITVGAAAPSRSLLASAGALSEYVAGQLLLAGPVLVALIILLWRRGVAVPAQAGGAQPGDPAHFALAFALPLLGIGLLQALNARTQMNWTAPALLGVCLWVGWRAVAAAAPRRWLVISTIVGVALASLLATAGDLRRFVPVRTASERPWDAWARMRGWDDALHALRPALTSQPGLPLRADSRDLIAHAAYAWRDLQRPVAALQFAGAPRHHYEMLAGRQPQAAGGPWLLLSAQPAAALHTTYPLAMPLAEGHGGRVVARLWLVPAADTAAGSP